MVSLCVMGWGLVLLENSSAVAVVVAVTAAAVAAAAVATAAVAAAEVAAAAVAVAAAAVAVGVDPQKVGLSPNRGSTATR